MMYKDSDGSFNKELDNAKEFPKFFEYVMASWVPFEKEFAGEQRKCIFHLGNTTNNRLER